MLRLKNLTAFSVVFCMLLSMFGTAFAYNVPEDVAGTVYEESAELLGALGIMVGDDDGEFRPNDTIIRSEFAKIAVHALGLEDVAETSKEASNFPDVVEGHWATGYINVAANQGIIVGDDVGTFRPDDKITYAEAVTILVRVLGHEPSALTKGAFPTGYLVVGNEIGITKGVSASAGAEINRGGVARMTYNALTIKLMERTGFGNDVSYEVVDKTLLADKLNVQKSNGLVQANGHTSLTGNSSLKKNEVNIGGEVYKLGDTNADKLLGHHVTFYYQEDDNSSDKTLLVVRTNEAKTDVITIGAEDIVSVTTDANSQTVVKYWVDKENDSESTEDVLSATAKLIYNGKSETFNTDKLTPTSGTLTLVDNDGDDIYDIAQVINYENHVVEDISTAANAIYDKYGKPTLTLDPDNKNVHFELTDLKGNEVALKDLKEWDVLAVAKSTDGKLLDLTLVRESVEGRITGKNDTKFFIEGKGYEVADNYTATINLNDQGVFYLDIDGRIAAIDTTKKASNNYAYLISAKSGVSFDDTLNIKLFNANGEVVTLETAEKIRFNGTANQTAETVLTALKNSGSEVVQQLITFETNGDNKINELTLATDKTSTGEIVANGFTLNMVANDVVYKSASSKLGNVVVGEETVVFNIPAGKTSATDFSMGNKNTFVNNNQYNIRVYDLKEDYTAGVIIVTNATGNPEENSTIAVVDQIAQTLDENDQQTDALEFFQDGEKKSLMAVDTTILVKDNGSGGTTALEQGDIIQYRLNGDGKIDNITLLFDIDDKATEAKTEHSDRLTTLYGKVTKKFSNSVNVTVNGAAEENYNIANATVYNYDSTKNSNKISVVTPGDVQRFEEANPRLVFMRIYDHEVKEIVIIR